jgi:hypothetical protein
MGHVVAPLAKLDERAEPKHDNDARGGVYQDDSRCNTSLLTSSGTAR